MRYILLTEPYDTCLSAMAENWRERCIPALLPLGIAGHVLRKQVAATAVDIAGFGNRKVDKHDGVRTSCARGARMICRRCDVEERRSAKTTMHGRPGSDAVAGEKKDDCRKTEGVNMSGPKLQLKYGQYQKFSYGAVLYCTAAHARTTTATAAAAAAAAASWRGGDTLQRLNVLPQPLKLKCPGGREGRGLAPGIQPVGIWSGRPAQSLPPPPHPHPPPCNCSTTLRPACIAGPG